MSSEEQHKKKQYYMLQKWLAPHFFPFPSHQFWRGNIQFLDEHKRKVKGIMEAMEIHYE